MISNHIIRGGKEMDIKKIVYTAFFITLGIIFPLIFHMTGGPGLGRLLLPMHLPVLLGSAFLGPLSGLVMGMITPLLSSFFTGMPPVIPMLPIMVFELGTYGLAMGYLFFELKLNVYLSLFITMISGRIVASLVVLILVYGFGLSQLNANPFIYIYGTIIAGLPGITGQLILIPIFLKYLKRYKSNKLS